MVQQLTVLIIDDNLQDSQKYQGYLRENSQRNYVILSNYAQITVSDRGIGINAEFLPYVFERYRQGETTRKKVVWD